MNCKPMNNNRRLALIVVFLSGLHSAIGCQGGKILSYGVSAEEKRLILKEHNHLRQTVATGHVPGQPSAQNMQEMRWDDELAAKAQQWANECTFQHDPSRYISRFIMGQNLGLLWSTIPLAADDGNFPMRIRNWFNEVQKYAWGAKWSVVTGHYSQLVWGDTNLVGCGFSYYQTSHLYNKLYVCNYGPGGNVVGKMPYATGTPKCGNFGMSDSARYPGLCKPYEQSFYATNSINGQQSPSTYFTYKSSSYKSEYGKQKVGTSSSTTRNNVQSNLTSQNNGAKANNEAYSFSRRKETKATTQQQYSNQRNPQPNSQIQQQSNRYQAASFHQSILKSQRQYQQRGVTNKTNPSQSHRWNQSLKNHL